MLRKLVSGIACFLLLAGSVSAAPVVIDFSGFVDQFNPGPHSPNVPLFGQIVLDDTVVASGPNNTFENAILSLTITVQDSGGDVTFTSAGPGGRVQQFVNNSTEFIGINFGANSSGIINGTVEGASGTLTMTDFEIDFRGVDLFGDPTVLATGLTQADFSFSELTVNYSTIGLEGLMVERSLDVVTFSTSESIDEPPMALFLSFSLLWLVGRARQAPLT